jgi:hypothetical protein
MRERRYKVLGDFANYLNEMAITHRLISASTASSFAYMIREDVTVENFNTRWQTLLYLVLKIKEENIQIVTTHFYQKIKHLRGIEPFKWESLLKIIEISISEPILLDSKVKNRVSSKKFIQIGRSAKPEHGNDIIFKTDKTLSRVHLVVTVENGIFFIEDRSANGTFVNGSKVEKGVRYSVGDGDEVRIGREGTLIDFKCKKIQELLK